MVVVVARAAVVMVGEGVAMEVAEARGPVS